MTSVSLRRKHKLTGKKVWPYLFLIPFFVIYLSFNFYPLIYSFVISLTQWDGFTEPVFVGLSNFVNIFTDDPYFLKSIENTLLFMLFNAPFVLIGGLILATMLNSKLIRGRNVFQLATFLPYLTIPVAIGVLFMLLFDWNSGLINRIFVSLGIFQEPVNFLGLPGSARFVVIMMINWKYIGYHAVFFSAGITSIPVELYESAEVDGASAFVKFRKITIPMLRPIIEFLLIMNIINGFQLFDEVKVLFSPWLSASGGAGTIGGPDRAALTAVWNLYDTSFGTQMQYGKGASIAYGLFLFILLFSLVALFILKRTNREEV